MAGPNPAAYGAVPVESAPNPADYGATPIDAIVAQQAGALGRKAKASASEFLGQQDKNVDYSGVNDPGARAMYSLLKTPEEQTAYLQKTYGPENVTQDSFGRPVIRRGDKLIAFKPRGDVSSGNLAAGVGDLAGEILPGAGMVAGALVGAPAGIPGSIIGSGLGGAIGETGNKLIKQLAGNNQQSSSEVAKDIVLTVPLGMAGEGLAQTAMLAGRTLMAPYAERSLFGPNEAAKPAFRQEQALMQEARDAGLKPAIGTVAPNANFVQRAQNARNRLFGDPLGLENRPVIEAKNAELMDALRNPGAANPPGFAAPQPPITRDSVAAQGEAVSNQLSGAIERKVATAEARAKTAMGDATRLLNDAQTRITNQVGMPSGGLATSVSNDVRTAKNAFSNKASELYAPVDELVGKPVVPTQGIKDVMRTILEEGPQTEAGKPVLASDAIKKFGNDILQMADNVTFQQMQVARSMLRDKSAVDALNAGLSERQAARLANAADQAFNDATSTLTTRTRSPILNQNGNPLTIVKTENVPGVDSAVNALRRADQFYAAGMKRFNDMSVEALVKDATQTGFIQPEKVAQYIASPGQVDKLMRIKKVVSPQTFAEVGREKWQQLVNSSTDSLTADVSGKKLADRLNQMGDSLYALYGQRQGAEMKMLAKQLAALDGKIPADSLYGGNINAAVKNAVKATEEFNALASKDYIKMVRADGPESLRAAEFLTDPSQRLRLRHTIATLGPQSAEAQGLKEYLARKIFASMEVPSHATQEKFGKTVLSGEELQKTLAQYGKPYLEDVFGKQWSDTVHKWADVAAAGTKRNPTDSGGLAAAAIGMKPFKNLMDLAHYAAIGWATNTGPMMTYMSKGIPGAQGDVAKVFRDMAANLTRAGIAEQIQSQPDRVKDYAKGAMNKVK